MKSILLYANEDAGLEARLQAALDLARADRGHITCIQVSPYQDYVVGDPFGGVYAIPALLNELNEKRAANRARLEARLNVEEACWSWVEADGDTAQAIVDYSHLADVVVLSLAGTNGAAPKGAMRIAGDTLIHTRTPILAVPSEARSFNCFGPALVAWNGSPESSYALRAALPLLKSSSQVHVVTVAEEEEGFPATQACEYLGWHGLSAELIELRPSNRSVGERIADTAADLGAAFVAMGGYGHSRFREAVMGGVTRAMLKQDSLPLLVGH